MRCYTPIMNAQASKTLLSLCQAPYHLSPLKVSTSPLLESLTTMNNHGSLESVTSCTKSLTPVIKIATRPSMLFMTQLNKVSTTTTNTTLRTPKAECLMSLSLFPLIIHKTHKTATTLSKIATRALTTTTTHRVDKMSWKHLTAKALTSFCILITCLKITCWTILPMTTYKVKQLTLRTAISLRTQTYVSTHCLS